MFLCQFGQNLVIGSEDRLLTKLDPDDLENHKKLILPFLLPVPIKYLCKIFLKSMQLLILVGAPLTKSYTITKANGIHIHPLLPRGGGGPHTGSFKLYVIKLSGRFHKSAVNSFLASGNFCGLLIT